MRPRSLNSNVPVHDRRQRRRFLTLKNFRNAAIAGLVLFAGISIRSELRGRHATEYYGQLYQSELPPVEQKPVEIVREAEPVAEATHADPTLIQPMVREQWLHDQASMTPVVTEVPVDNSQRAVASVQSGETRLAIVGGTDGVAIVKQERSRPQLSGGFGRN